MNELNQGTPRAPEPRPPSDGALVADRGPGRAVLLRDLVIFELKLSLDGLKDVFLAPLAVLAAVLDLLAEGPRFGHRFYSVVKAGERFDLWLNLYGPAAQAASQDEGLFGTAGSDRLIDRLEEIARDVTRGEPSGRTRPESGTPDREEVPDDGPRGARDAPGDGTAHPSP
ncbi:MAG: hypothetical protein ACE5HF_07160 [Gemmatimonadota bacterium]